jgi:hypothetical protein
MEWFSIADQRHDVRTAREFGAGLEIENSPVWRGQRRLCPDGFCYSSGP